MADGRSINDFDQEVNCTFKDKLYSVRDNGAVLRHVQYGGRAGLNDNRWTFGKLNVDKGYMEIASVPIHRIVATAFHGPAPTPQHIVDHTDTDRQNNRSVNLRWITKLENVLLNTMTGLYIGSVCGSIEAFLADPSQFRDKFLEPNYEWLGKIGIEEANASLERMLSWAKSDKTSSGGTLYMWIYERKLLKQPASPAPEDIIIPAITSNAVQRNWKIASEFPCCPQQYADEPMKAYAEALKAGLVFCRNNQYSSLVYKSAISEDSQLLYVLSESENIKPYALAEITYEDNLFVHTSVRTFFELNGAEKYFCLAQGLDWTGGDGVDDYC